jgi:hypothetical protein
VGVYGSVFVSQIKSLVSRYDAAAQRYKNMMIDENLQKHYVATLRRCVRNLGFTWRRGVKKVGLTQRRNDATNK